MDRGKCGTKRNVLTEGQGLPRAVVVAGANRHDMKLLADTLDAVVVERSEPTKVAPQHVCLDKGYDDDECRPVAEQHAYIPHIRSRGEEQREKREIPGYRARRWVVAEVARLSGIMRLRQTPGGGGPWTLPAATRRSGWHCGRR